MTLLLALTIAALFGSGAYLLLKHDLSASLPLSC